MHFMYFFFSLKASILYTRMFFRALFFLVVVVVKLSDSVWNSH